MLRKSYVERSKQVRSVEEASSSRSELESSERSRGTGSFSRGSLRRAKVDMSRVRVEVRFVCSQ